MDLDVHTSSLADRYKCDGCGAMLAYQPGTNYLECSYCGTKNKIVNTDDDELVESVEFEDFSRALNDLSDLRYTVQAEVVKCENCGATATLDKNLTSDICGFCATPLVIDHHLERIVKPHGIIPFVLNEKKVYPLYAKWAKNLWFAPNDFNRIFQAHNHRLKGVYIPFWSFDAQADTSYSGERGEYYYETKTVKGPDGKNTTVREQKTRWYFASGSVFNNFKDIIVTASSSLPAKFASQIGPCDMNSLKSFKEHYLSGFMAETYSVDQMHGKIAATQIMEGIIRETVRRDIGGDTQRIHRMEPKYSDIRIKYILLPIWLSAYQYKGKTYQIMVNAFNGRVFGQRPYSFWKIAGAILLVLIIFIVFIIFSR